MRFAIRGIDVRGVAKGLLKTVDCKLTVVAGWRSSTQARSVWDMSFLSWKNEASEGK